MKTEYTLIAPSGDVIRLAIRNSTCDKDAPVRVEIIGTDLYYQLDKLDLILDQARAKGVTIE